MKLKGKLGCLIIYLGVFFLEPKTIMKPEFIGISRSAITNTLCYDSQAEPAEACQVFVDFNEL